MRPRHSLRQRPSPRPWVVLLIALLGAPLAGILTGSLVLAALFLGAFAAAAAMLHLDRQIARECRRRGVHVAPGEPPPADIVRYCAGRYFVPWFLPFTIGFFILFQAI